MAATVEICVPGNLRGFYSVVISRPWSGDSSALEFILSRSRSRDLMAMVSVLVSRPEVQGLGLGLKTVERLACAPSKKEKLPLSLMGLINPPPSLSKITYKYNTMLTYIPVSFLFSFKKGLGLKIGLGWILGLGGAVGAVGWCARKTSVQDSMLGAYACSTITVICSTFKQVLCHQLELMQPVMWSWDHDLETRVHSSSFCPGLGLGLETWSLRSRSWSRDLMAKVSVLLSRPDGQGLGLGLETWSPRSQSRDLMAKVSLLVSRPDGQGLGLALETWWPSECSGLKT